MTAMPFVYDLSCSPAIATYEKWAARWSVSPLDRFHLHHSLHPEGGVCLEFVDPKKFLSQYNVSLPERLLLEAMPKTALFGFVTESVPNLVSYPVRASGKWPFGYKKWDEERKGFVALLPSGRIIRPCIPSLEQALSWVHAQSLEVPPSDADEGGPIVEIIPRSKRRNARFRYGENGNWTDVTNVLGEREAALFNQISA